ncbi:ankyrin repeat, SAM and basic leucine zipper domain-containing protein 1-like [Macrosteles quadrilineatus]|uniref:ankyrin repeat, SAM and basic leucine zipper domain-containing protein 1-like n=1 Tax=Macrosteles quadrilineatus TaxID=74068 RepID=UPI0023E2C855|nr:ankyrin repeat, SAM and basic leucine zipper domain-containing protein 1-like [Macrosteles quadrilineatus]
MSYYPAGLSDDDDDDFSDGLEFSNDYNDSYRTRDLVKTSETNETLLYNALLEENIEAMKSVLDSGFNVDQPVKGGWSALMYACSFAYFPAIELLISRGANVNFNKELFTPLMALCKSKSSREEELSKCMDLLLENGANINSLDRNASTALIYASAEGHTQLVKTLVDLKCDLNIQDTEGWSALFHAVFGGYDDIVRTLVEAKARVDLIDRRKRSAYELAVLKGHDHLGELVCSKKERRRLKAEADESEDVPEVSKTRDPIEELMNQLPRSNVKNSSGFSSDVGKLLWSMKLGHLNKQFSDQNVELNEILLITDERLKELRVRFSVHRHRILTSIRKFHLRPWSKSSLGLKPRNEQTNVDDAVKVICNVIKHLHVLSATVNYVRLHQPIPLGAEVFKMCENSAHQLHLISGELSNIQYFSSQLKVKEPITPVDLIKPKNNSNKGYMRSMFVVTVLVGLVFWKRKILISLPIIQRFFVQ